MKIRPPKTSGYVVVKKPVFEDDDEDDIPQAPRRFKVPAIKPRKRFLVGKPKPPLSFAAKLKAAMKKRKGRELQPHDLLMKLKELYDDERYAVTIRLGSGGTKTKVLDGFSLKGSWKEHNLLVTAPLKEVQLAAALEHYDGGHNILVNLPNGMQVSVQVVRPKYDKMSTFVLNKMMGW